MFNLLKKLYPLKLAPVSEDMDLFANIVSKELPFNIHKYRSGSEYNGWIVPQGWKVYKAIIKKNNKIIFDGTNHPLGVVGYSPSFNGVVTLKELKKHLFYHPTLPDALVYHCDYYYKPWKKEWGFCVPYSLFKNLTEGTYEINLITEYKKADMMVFDYFLEGASQQTIILNAHNCHAGQANDDISGVVVGIEIMKELRKIKNRYYSYRLIIAPEHFGTVFYLSKLTKKDIDKLSSAIFLEMLGNENKISLQESFTGESLIDKAAHHYLQHNHPTYFSDKFRTIVGNDETVWEAPGYEIPCISISRWPYHEYHSSNDNEHIISNNKLKESLSMMMGILEIMETNFRIKRNFNGLISLSNPKYDLYISTVDPSIRNTISKNQIKWNRLMNYLFRYFNSEFTILDIAIKHDIYHKDLYDYLQKFVDKKLITYVQR